MWQCERGDLRAMRVSETRLVRVRHLARHACERAPGVRGAGSRGGRVGRGAHEQAAKANDLVEDVGVPEVVGETIRGEDQDVVLLHGYGKCAHVVRAC